MRWKKLLISTIITVGVVAPLAAMIAIGSNSRPAQASSSYLMNFNKNSKEYEYVENLKKQVAEVFTEYKKKHPNFNGLELEFITLNPTLTPGEVNFFSELNKSLMAINENLSFKIVTRNPVTLQQGYYQKNVDMTSFRWSPDYNGIGTWLTYMFSEYQIANMWPPLASIINKYSTNETGMPEWVKDLREHLKNFSFTGSNGEIPIVNNNNIAITYEEIWAEGAKIREKDPNTKWTINIANSSIGNAVGAWANKNLSTSTGTLNNNPTAMANGLYKSFEGGFDLNASEKFKPSYPAEMLDYLTTFNTNIPYVQDGGNTINSILIRKGAHIPFNPNANPNFRDYYRQNDLFKSDIFKQRIKSDPFVDTISPFNPTFTKSSTTTFNTIYTPLFSWSTIGDYYSSENSNGGLNIKNDFKVLLTSLGTSMKVDDFNAEFEKLFNQDGTLKDENNSAVGLPIRPIPWVNSSGETTNNVNYLSPQDFLAGFIGYYKSVITKFNKNHYFINLAQVDIEKTIKDPRNNVRNLSENGKHEPFYIHFKKKELGGQNIADILSMQYFNALPAFSDKVKNIIDDTKFNKLAVLDDNGVLDANKSKMTEFYGNGAGKDPNVWKSLWSASPYYVSDVNDTRYVFQKNEKFFKFFDGEIKKMAPNDQEDYKSYLETYQVNGKEVSKISTFQMTYGNDYKDQITYEQFKVGELDYTTIPTALKNEVYKTSLKNNLYYAPTTKVNKSDLIPYNLQVFDTENDGTPRFVGHKNNISILPLLKSDKYGNVIYPEGYTPQQKSKISPGYTDLIVNNFYTPIDGTDDNGQLLPVIERSSAIIKTAINDCINWMSINSLIAQDITRSFQNSFFPFGVAKIGGDADVLDPRWDYWNYAAYKIGKENVELGKRTGGLIEWTLPQLLESWERQAKGTK